VYPALLAERQQEGWQERRQHALHAHRERKYTCKGRSHRYAHCSDDRRKATHIRRGGRGVDATAARSSAERRLTMHMGTRCMHVLHQRRHVHRLQQRFRKYPMMTSAPMLRGYRPRISISHHDTHHSINQSINPSVRARTRSLSRRV
jgi:hypothetical protein